MTTSIGTAGPMVLDQAGQVAEFLLEAQEALVLVLTRRGVKRVESGGSLIEVLKEAGRHTDHCRGSASIEVFGSSEQETLGHAPAWVDAGMCYEALLTEVAEGGEPDLIISLDPWTAQLMGKVSPVPAKSRWVCVSDRDPRTNDDPSKYWERMTEWFMSLPFALIIRRDVWDRVLAGQAPTAKNTAIEPAANSQYLQEPGAWQWRGISGSSSPKTELERPLLLLIRYSGSLPHLRILLDSLGRLDYPKKALRSVLLHRGGKEDPKSYLRWYTLAQPDLCPIPIGEGHGDDRAWENSLNALLKGAQGSTIVLVDDHAILPTTFAREVSRLKTAVSFYDIPVGADATAHIVTGNLDPVVHYEKLLRAFDGAPGARSEESVRVLPPEVWNTGDDEPLGRVFKLTREAGTGDPDLPPGQMNRVLLQLADLP